MITFCKWGKHDIGVGVGVIRGNKILNKKKKKILKKIKVTNGKNSF